MRYNPNKPFYAFSEEEEEEERGTTTMTNHNHIPTLRDRLWWAITMELSEKSILQAEVALQEAILLAEIRKDTYMTKKEESKLQKDLVGLAEDFMKELGENNG